MNRNTVRTAALGAAVTVAGLALAACGSGGKAAAGSFGATGGAFPVTVQTSSGKVVVSRRPSRIVSLSATATEMLFSVGAGSQVVAVDEYSTTPAKAPHTHLNAMQVSAEGLQVYKPDLVLLAPGGDPNLVTQLGALHVPALVEPPANDLADTWSQYRQIGLATGHPSQAASEVSILQSQIASAVRSAGHRGRGKTYYIEFSSDLYSATSKTFDGALFNLLGMRNIADSASGGGDGYPQLSAEFLVKTDPAYVFLADDVCCGQSAATFATRPGFATLSAVKAKHVYVINDSVASEWGPNIVEFVHEVVNALKGQKA
jgi:iron complex transport system substrate-binding protein